MKALSITLTAALLIGSSQSIGQTSRHLTTETADGGTVVTSYGATHAEDINKDSTLHRSWYTINDDACPIQLLKAGVQTEKRIGTLDFQYKPIVQSFVAKEPIMAMEIRFALYDVFNEHIVTLVITRVEDVAAPGPFVFKTGFQDTMQGDSKNRFAFMPLQ